MNILPVPVAELCPPSCSPPASSPDQSAPDVPGGSVGPTSTLHSTAHPASCVRRKATQVLRVLMVLMVLMGFCDLCCLMENFMCLPGLYNESINYFGVFYFILNKNVFVCFSFIL